VRRKLTVPMICLMPCLSIVILGPSYIKLTEMQSVTGPARC